MGRTVRSCDFGTLGTVIRGAPELSLMFVTFDEEFKDIIFSSADDRKVANIRNNPKVSVLLNGYDGDSESVAVTLDGNATLLSYAGDPEKYTQYQAKFKQSHLKDAAAFEGMDKIVIVLRPAEAL